MLLFQDGISDVCCAVLVLLRVLHIRWDNLYKKAIQSLMEDIEEAAV